MAEFELYPRHRHRWSSWILPSVILTIAAAVCLATFNGLIVCWRAEVIAGGRPYCIQAAGPDWYGYHPVKRLSEMSVWAMQGKMIPGASSSIGTAQNHAILVLDSKSRFFNWSYMSENFKNEVLNRSLYEKSNATFADARYAPPTVCEPVKHFASTISWF